jgi:hypothetical protein
MPEPNSRASEKLRGSILVAKMMGIMNSTQQIFCEYIILHAAQVSSVSAGEII